MAQLASSRLLVLLLAVSSAALATTAPPSMYAAFAAFAEYADGATRALFDKRKAFFAARSEEEIRAMPEHEARNAQEAVLGLQQRLLPPGLSVRLHGLRGHALEGCDAVLVSCLRDGSFRCAVETQCGLEQDAEPMHARVHVANLRPATSCAAAAAADGCDGADDADELDRGGRRPLDQKAVGQLLVDTVMQSRAEQLPAEFVASFPGETAFPDLPYASLAAVLERMRLLACGALAAGDPAGAAAAIEKALDLELKSRPAAKDEHEVVVRRLLARLLAARGAAARAKGDEAGARRDAIAAQRLNVTAAVSNRKLDQATSRAQRGRPHGVTGLTAEESAELQRWFETQLVPLDEHAGAGAEGDAAAGSASGGGDTDPASHEEL